MNSGTMPQDDDQLRADFESLARGTSRASHPAEHEWVSFATGTLTASERERFSDHLVSCAECTAVYRAVTHVRQEASAFDAGAPRPNSSTRSHWSRALLPQALAASLLVVSIGLLVWNLRLQQRTVDLEAQINRIARTTSPRVTETPAPVASPAAPVAPAEPRAWALGQTAPDVRLPAYLALSVRGADKERDELLHAFGEGLAPYREGRFREAADRLAPLAARQPNVPEVAFYLGVARLFAGEPSAAIAPLREARSSDVVSHDARWYEAVALERSGRREDADAALRELCKIPSPYQATACAPVRGMQ
jgi:hypothetical protein